MAEKPDADALKNQNAAIIDEFRANGGKVGGPFEGANLLLLTTTGAKSGQQRLNPLAYFTIDGKISSSARMPAPMSTRPGCTTCGPTRGRTSRWAPTPTT